MKGFKVCVDENVGWYGVVVSEPVHTFTVDTDTHKRYHYWFVLVMNSDGEVVNVDTDDLIVRYTDKGASPKGGF